MSHTTYFDQEVNACGLYCPLPILKAKKALANMQPGQVLKISATDPSSMADFQAFTHQTGHVLLHQSTLNEVFVHYLQRR
jgi:tRNA 2-thiouridine synthesizing protein A